MIVPDDDPLVILSVVIPTWNSATHLETCLTSLARQSYRARDIFIVDNGSTDDTCRLARRDDLPLTLVCHSTNIGFCRAVNHGIRASSGTWVLVLNSDTELTPGTLAALSAAAVRLDPSVGMIGGKLLRMDRRTLDSTGLVLSRAWRFFDRGAGEPDHGQYDASGEVWGVCAAAALYRRAMLEAIAEGDTYFDERFFALVEDVDLTLRARRAGWRAWYEPRAVIYHARNGSGLSRRVRQALSLRNRYYLLWKHATRRSLVADLPWLAPYELLRLPAVLATNRLAWRALQEALCNGSKIRQRGNQIPATSNQTVSDQQTENGGQKTETSESLSSDP